jgi:hypothetical protein
MRPQGQRLIHSHHVRLNLQTTRDRPRPSSRDSGGWPTSAVGKDEAVASDGREQMGVPGRPAGVHFSKSARSGAPLSYFARCSTDGRGYTPPQMWPAASGCSDFAPTLHTATCNNECRTSACPGNLHSLHIQRIHRIVPRRKIKLRSTSNS